MPKLVGGLQSKKRENLAFCDRNMPLCTVVPWTILSILTRSTVDLLHVERSYAPLNKFNTFLNTGSILGANWSARRFFNAARRGESIGVDRLCLRAMVWPQMFNLCSNWTLASRAQKCPKMEVRHTFPTIFGHGEAIPIVFSRKNATPDSFKAVLKEIGGVRCGLPTSSFPYNVVLHYFGPVNEVSKREILLSTMWPLVTVTFGWNSIVLSKVTL